MSSALMWFRRDLRLDDNAALYHALREADRVWCCFCFDREILDALEDRADRRVEFIHDCVTALGDELARRGGGLIIRHAHARQAIPAMARELGADRVYANHDYEPACRDRDAEVARALAKDGREFRTFKDHVIFETDELLNKAGAPFRVYTHYRKAWREALTDFYHRPYPSGTAMRGLAAPVHSDPWTLADLGFEKTDLRWRGGARAGRATFDAFLMRIDQYATARDYPGIEGTSRLSVHLRFGTVGIRHIVSESLDHGSEGAQKWVDELVWRDFYNAILFHFPHVEHRAFRPEFDDFPWRRDEEQFRAWCEGRTGYPIVDAGMRELNSTGYMHNRLRMITASFLTKDLLIDWRWGERYFARKLLDYDLSQNVGGWQWSAGVGTDAQPFFRIFNPVTQSERFDGEGIYIRRHVPELADVSDAYIHAPWEAPPLLQSATGCEYPPPIVDHAEARKAALRAFEQVRARA